MAEPIYYRFNVKSPLSECLQEASDPNKDPCKVELEDADSGTTFLLQRKGSGFEPSPSDAGKILRAYPSFHAPAKELADYLLSRSAFFKVFGEESKPNEILQKFDIHTSGGEKVDSQAIFGWVNYLSDFVSHGDLNPKLDKIKRLQELSLTLMTGAYEDPTVGALFNKVLAGLKDNPSLSAESRKRAAWLLTVDEIRGEFWNTMKPQMDQSKSLAFLLKSRSSLILKFLLINHLLADKGSEDALFPEDVQDDAKAFDEILSQLDPNYNAAQNYYAYMMPVLRQLKGVKVPEEYQKEFLMRLDLAESQYEKAAQQETIRLLSAKVPESALREYLVIKYGDTPSRAAILKILLQGLTVKTEHDKPVFAFAMKETSKKIKDWTNSLPLTEKKVAMADLMFLLKGLFEKDEKMEIFWDKKIQATDNFYSSFPLIGADRTALEELIRWTRSEAKDAGIKTPPGQIPHVALRKATFFTELGIGVAGVGTALALIAAEDGPEKYYGQGAAAIIGGAGLGAAAGNSLSYAFDVDKFGWTFDLSGLVVGGLAAGLTYGLTTPFPTEKPPVTNPGQRFPVDPYGP